MWYHIPQYHAIAVYYCDKERDEYFENETENLHDFRSDRFKPPERSRLRQNPVHSY
jgi:hypothetical protein